MLPRQENGDGGITNGANNPAKAMPQRPREDQPYDVIVVGGGAAGIGAAIGAKKTTPNARILIVESEGCLGGAATHRGVLSYCGLYSVGSEPRRAVGTIWTEIHSRLVEERAANKLPDCIVAYVQVCG